jgi:hypothetical protein
MNIKDRSGSTPGTIQNFGAKHLTTSDRAVAQAGTSDAYIGDGPQCDAQPAEFQGSVNQNAPALKVAKPTTTPIVARPTKTEGFSGVRKAVGVSSHPGLMAAHRHGSISKDDASVVHGRGTEPVKTMSKPESAGSTMPQPVVAKLHRGYAEMGQEVTTGPVTAHPTGEIMRAK